MLSKRIYPSKLKLVFFSSLLLIIACSNSDTTQSNTVVPEESISDNWEIALWKNFSKSAITHTWDDNTAKQITTALPIYEEFNFKVTFFIANLWNPDWNGFKNASLNGHEIASHTMTHTSFADLNDEQIAQELSVSKNLINQKLGNNDCITFAYPYCVSENNNLTKNYFIAARGCNGQIVPSSPLDFMNISSFVCGTEGNNKNASDFNIIADDASNQNGWGVYLFHGIDNDGGWSPVTSENLRLHLEYLKANKNKFWVDTFVNVVKYIKERQSTTIVQSQKNQKMVAASISNDLESSVYNFPITIKKQIPKSWTQIVVKQNNVEIMFETTTEASKKYVVFNAVPNVGEVQIEKI